MKNEQESRDTLMAKASEDAEFRARLLENPHAGKLSELEMGAIAGGSHCHCAGDGSRCFGEVPSYP